MAWIQSMTKPSNDIYTQSAIYKILSIDNFQITPYCKSMFCMEFIAYMYFVQCYITYKQMYTEFQAKFEEMLSSSNIFLSKNLEMSKLMVSSTCLYNKTIYIMWFQEYFWCVQQNTRRSQFRLYVFPTIPFVSMTTDDAHDNLMCSLKYFHYTSYK